MTSVDTRTGTSHSHTTVNPDKECGPFCPRAFNLSVDLFRDPHRHVESDLRWSFRRTTQLFGHLYLDVLSGVSDVSRLVGVVSSSEALLLYLSTSPQGPLGVLPLLTVVNLG